MTRDTIEELVFSIDDVNCQIDYLEQAMRLNMADLEDECRLNSLIVKRAYYRKELDDIQSKNTICTLISKLPFHRHPKRICDYFLAQPTD